MLHLVRHGRPLVQRDRVAATWDLDPAGFDDVWSLRESGRLPGQAAWFCSPEAKAIQTAQLLTECEIGIMDDLREHVRDSSDWISDFDTVVRRAFEHPDRPAYDGWEPLESCRSRVTTTVRGILATHQDEEIVLVGHGTAWTLLAAELTGNPPDLDRWTTLQMPDVIALDA
jgi:broad specificity phosphatase PhoE